MVKWYNNTLLKVAFSSCLGVLGWVLHASLESFFFPNKTFLRLLLTDVSLQDIVIRCIVSGCFFVFGIILLNNAARRRRTEEELKKANESLHRINKLLEQKINERTVEIETLLKQKNDLIVGFSHDLKTPLTPLIGYLPMIAREEKDPKLKKLMEISLRNVHYIRDLVSKTLDLALLDSTIVGLSPEKTNLFTEVDTILEHRSYVLHNHQILVNNKIDEHIFVNADKLRLREVLNNLVMNSIKYTSSSGGMITIDAIQEKDKVMVSVTDTGIGLTREQLNHIFDELYKADSARQDHTSTGLGLSICKRIVEKQGGTIWAESPGQGKGTTVYFTLPSAP